MLDYVYPWIDTHLHCRDQKLKYKGSTIGSTSKLSKKYGGRAFVDMPNNDPVTVSLKEVFERFRIAVEEGCIESYYLNMGLTKEPKQIEDAAHAVTVIPKLNALKFFTTGKETDVLAIKKEEDIDMVYRTLKKCGYRGVVIPHCEDESKFIEGSFNLQESWKWNDLRPIEAEELAVYKQLKISAENEFEGRLHIPHVSSPKTVVMLEDAYKGGRKVSGEITPHHLLKSTEDMRGPDGPMLKTNPPIRSLEIVKLLWKELKNTIVPFTTGSDNAPHTMDEKMKPPHMSGYQSIPLYPSLLQEMRGREFPEEHILRLASANALEIFPKIKVI